MPEKQKARISFALFGVLNRLEFILCSRYDKEILDFPRLLSFP